MMKKYLGTGIIVLVVLLGGIGLMVADAASSPLANEQATLSVTTGTVQLEHAGETSWNSVTGDTVVTTGDSIKTDATGEATVNLFDQGAIRLDHNTTITLTAADLSADDSGTFTGNITIETGRLWSRVLTFLSPESSFEVTTPTSVATVRGTIFSVWVKDGKSGVYVDEHSVDVASGGTTKMIAAGEFVSVDQNARELMTVSQSIDQDLSDWINKNRPADHIFDRNLTKKLQAARLQGNFVTDLLSQFPQLKSRLNLKAKLLDRAKALEIEKPALNASPTLQIDTRSSLQITTTPTSR